MKAWRNVRCLLCRRMVPERRAERAGLGEDGRIPVWLCRRCARDPEAALRARREQEERDERD